MALTKEFPFPEDGNEFYLRRFYASLVSKAMDSGPEPLRPEQAARTASEELGKVWRAKFGDDPMPFTLDLLSVFHRIDAPGGTETDDGRVWMTAAFVEEGLTAFEDDPLTHRDLREMALNYDASHRSADVIIPNGEWNTHTGSLFERASVAKIDAVSSDGQHLWVLVRSIKGRLERAILDGLETRSISWIRNLKDIEPSGAYVDHLAILGAGEQPGQPGHIKNSDLADFRRRLEIEEMGEEKAEALASSRALDGKKCSRAFQFPSKPDKEIHMAEEAAVNAVEEEVAPVAETADRALPGEKKNAEAVEVAGSGDVGGVHAATMRGMNENITLMSRQLTEALSNNAALKAEVLAIQANQASRDASTLVAEIDASLNSAVNEGRIKRGSVSGWRSMLIGDDGDPKMSRDGSVAVLNQIATIEPSGAALATSMIEFDAKDEQPLELNRNLHASAQKRGSVSTDELAMQALMDHVAGAPGADELTGAQYRDFTKLVGRYRAGSSVADLVGGAN